MSTIAGIPILTCQTLALHDNDSQNEAQVTLTLRECTTRYYMCQIFSSNSRTFKTSLAANDWGRPMRVKTEKMNLSAYVYGTHKSVSLVNFELYMYFQVNIRAIFSAEFMGYSLKINISIWHPLLRIPAFLSTRIKNWRMVFDLEQFNSVTILFSGWFPHGKHFTMSLFFSLFSFVS